MKNPYTLSCLCILFFLWGSWNTVSAQTTVSTEKPLYRWLAANPLMKLPEATVEEYKNLPQVDYTPVNSLREWSAEAQIRSFSNGLQKQLTALYIFTVDESGYIKGVKTVRSNDSGNAKILASLIKGTKLAGPSYLLNKAVSAHIPCSVTISKTEITIL